MEKIQYSVWKKETNSAGGKAKNDAYDIMLELGFKSSYNPSDIRIIRIFQQLFSLKKFIGKKIKFIQYPTLQTNIFNLFLKFLKKKDKSIALIHDISSIQGMSNISEIKEINKLKKFNYLIVHNRSMADYIKNLGYKGKLINLKLFDYLHDSNKRIINNSYSKSISFAGNLEKSKFLLSIAKIKNYKFYLYGLKGNMDFSELKNSTYKGCLNSEEIVYKLEGDYGLVWDGESIDGCKGVYGEYLKYNNPHKLSLYIAAGKPVITWKKAAIADFVLENRIGIIVDSLEELNTLDLSKDYEEMKSNVLKLKKLIAEGFYLKSAINKILNEEESKYE